MKQIFRTSRVGFGRLFKVYECQQILIARAMMSKSRLLLLDELSTDLDRSSKTKLCDLLNRVNENTTALVCTQDLGQVPLIAKSVVTVNPFLHYNPKPDITDLALHVMCISDVDHHCPLPEMTNFAATSWLNLICSTYVGGSSSISCNMPCLP